MAIQLETIIQKYSDLLTYVSGDRSVLVEAPSAQEKPLKGGIAFTSDIQHLRDLSHSNLAALVISSNLLPQAKELTLKPTLLTSKNPYLAMAKVNGTFFKLPFLQQPFQGHTIHPSATVHKSAKIADSVIIGPGVVIDENTVIESGTYIGANTVIEPFVKIGRDCTIHSLVFIGHTTRIGDRVEIKSNSTIGSDGFGFAQDEKRNSFKIPHYGELIIEDDVSIGANVNIDRGTFNEAKISKGTKIDNHCHFGHNVIVGENCLITAGFITAGSSKIGDRCSFAGRASLNGKTEICSDVTIGPLSAVTNDIKSPGVYGGFPAIPMRDFLKASASFGSLPRMRKNLTRILSHLGLKDAESKE